MNKSVFFFTILILLFSCSPNAPEQKVSTHKNSLVFNADGKLKIVQFTDIHYKSTSDRKQENLDIMEHVLAVEKPDFVVLTGDIVNDPVEQGWKEISQPMIDAKVPWTVTFGNHDGETDIKKDQIFSMLNEMPLFIGEKGTVSGVNNFALPVLSHDSTKVAAVLYMFDSQEYCETRKYSKYDFIRFDQIAWYRSVSEKFTRKNQNREIPSLAFFHIPLQEFSLVNEENKEKTRFTGQQFESVKPSGVNSGLFASFVEMKDVFAAFAGHDHENSFIGQLGDICLSYGQVTGVEAVDTNITRGARIIKIYDSRFALESWVRTPDNPEKQFHFYYPESLAKPQEHIHASVDLENPQKGIRYRYYEGQILFCDQIKNLQLKEEGTVENISLEPAKTDDHFAFEFEGYIKVPETGMYSFYTNSDDGSRLYIGEELVVDNDGSHSKAYKSGNIGLQKGFHTFKLQYFEDYMGSSLTAGYTTLSSRESTGIEGMLYFEE
jgi:hypothetical protein